MATKKSEANNMVKMQERRGCGKDFSKTMMKKCGRCKYVVYCSKECNVNDWPPHKMFCKRATTTTRGQIKHE